MIRSRSIRVAIAAFVVLGALVAAQAQADFLVGSYATNQVLRYDTSGAYVGVFANVFHPTSLYQAPTGGKVYIGSYNTNVAQGTLASYNMDGSLDTTFTTSGGWVSGIVASAGYVYAADGASVRYWGPGGITGSLFAPDPMPSPSGLAVDSAGSIYASMNISAASGGSIIKWASPMVPGQKLMDATLLADIDVVTSSAGETIRGLHSMGGSTGGIYAGWTLAGGWNPGNGLISPYLPLGAVPEWPNAIAHTGGNNAYIVGSTTGVAHYTFTDANGWQGSVFIPGGSGGLSGAYGLTVFVPEPSSLLALLSGCVGLAGLRLRRR